MDVKKLGRAVKGFDPELWDIHKFDIVVSYVTPSLLSLTVCVATQVRGNRLKFSQNHQLRRLLLSTADKTLVEAAGNDAIWGIGINVKQAYAGAQWRGENLLGEALMQVRGELCSSACLLHNCEGSTLTLQRKGSEEVDPSDYVVNVKTTNDYDVYIGRMCRTAPQGADPKWGNPFVMKKEADRNRVIQQYESWINAPEQARLREEAKSELKGMRLGCFCAPLACHGHVLARIANGGIEAAAGEESNPARGQTRESKPNKSVSAKDAKKAARSKRAGRVQHGPRKGY